MLHHRSRNCFRKITGFDLREWVMDKFWWVRAMRDKGKVREKLRRCWRDLGKLKDCSDVQTTGCVMDCLSISTDCLTHVFRFPISPPQASPPGYSYSSIALSSFWYSVLLVNYIYCLSPFPHWTWLLWRKGILVHGSVSSPYKTAWHIVGPHKHCCWIGARKRSTVPSMAFLSPLVFCGPGLILNLRMWERAGEPLGAPLQSPSAFLGFSVLRALLCRTAASYVSALSPCVLLRK